MNVINFLGPCNQGVRVIDVLLADFYHRYQERKGTHSVIEVQLRLNCILAALVRLYPVISTGAIGLGALNTFRFEKNLSYLIRYALSEMCCYYRYRCE